MNKFLLHFLFLGSFFLICFESIVLGNVSIIGDYAGFPVSHLRLYASIAQDRPSLQVKFLENIQTFPVTLW